MQYIIKKQWKVVLHYVTLTNHYHFKLDFQHPAGKWFNHGTKHHKDNQLQSLELPNRISQSRMGGGGGTHYFG